MRRTAGLALLTVAVLASAACGGGGGSPSPAGQARGVVERFYSDIEAARGAAACALLAPAAREEVVRPPRQAAPRKQVSCQQVLQSYSEAVGRDAASLAATRATRFGSVSVIGEHAMVVVDVPHEGQRAAPLVMTPDGWRISQIGSSFRKPNSG